MNAVLGLDIGGANLKAAHVNGAASLQPFALWKNPQGLPQALQALLHNLPEADTLAVTMTGELCDCFETKRQGVQHILDAVETVAGKRRLRVWRSDGKLTDVAAARAAPLQVAAANWLALATFAGRFAARGPGLLIDIGSTTTDLVPLAAGRPVPQGRTDPERLRHHELLYVGVRRTPVCALLGTGGAAELFATTLDVFLTLGALFEDKADLDTADGRPATRAAAHARLARMLCADAETCAPEETRRLAERVLLKLVYHLGFAVEASVKHLPGPPQTLVLAGSGEFLADLILREQKAFAVPAVVSLADQLGPQISQAACAYALAVLAAEA
jgi:(4-(4-[2-(gamma-L-glutamylamino)ethyl]phenoxymethyl)furan-2-yl)methanamine synthase